MSDFRFLKENTHDNVLVIREKTVMSMESLNFIQFIELFAGFLGFTTLLPGLVFYRKVKRFPAAVRFLIYFIIGNFYIIYFLRLYYIIVTYIAILYLFLSFFSRFEQLCDLLFVYFSIFPPFFHFHLFIIHKVFFLYFTFLFFKKL